MARTRALNISEGGIAIELPEAAMPLSMVRFQSDRFKVRGAGAVRHCRRVGSKWIVGLEFIEGLRWSPPEGEVIEPDSDLRSEQLRTFKAQVIWDCFSTLAASSSISRIRPAPAMQTFQLSTRADSSRNGE